MAMLLADENFPLSVTVALRALGHDVVTVQEEGLAGQPDPDGLAHGTHASRAVLTLDRDFIRLHTATHAGIVHCTYDSDISALAARIDGAVSAAPLTDTLVRVRRPATS